MYIASQNICLNTNYSLWRLPNQGLLNPRYPRLMNSVPAVSTIIPLFCPRSCIFVRQITEDQWSSRSLYGMRPSMWPVPRWWWVPWVALSSHGLHPNQVAHHFTEWQNDNIFYYRRQQTQSSKENQVSKSCIHAGQLRTCSASDTCRWHHSHNNDTDSIICSSKR